MTDASTPTVRYWRHVDYPDVIEGTTKATHATYERKVQWEEVVVMTPAELDAIKAEVAEKARADERERIARVIESKRLPYVGERPPVVETRNSALDQAARIARTPDQIGDTP